VLDFFLALEWVLGKGIWMFKVNRKFPYEERMKELCVPGVCANSAIPPLIGILLSLSRITCMGKYPSLKCE